MGVGVRVAVGLGIGDGVRVAVAVALGIAVAVGEPPLPLWGGWMTAVKMTPGFSTSGRRGVGVAVASRSATGTRTSGWMRPACAVGVGVARVFVFWPVPRVIASGAVPRFTPLATPVWLLAADVAAPPPGSSVA
jgi:hypothetical protein